MSSRNFGRPRVCAEALERPVCEPVDVALIDIHMPVMDGLEALAKIRAGEAGRRDLPVIALTADAREGANAKLLAAGFDAVAAKPINPQQVVAMVVAAVDALSATPPARANA